MNNHQKRYPGVRFRRLRAVVMRNQGKRFKEIGDRLGGVTAGRARQLYLVGRRMLWQTNSRWE